MALSAEEAAAIAEGIGRARGLRPGQLPSGEQFAEALNGMEECAAYVALVGQPRAPYPYPRSIPVPVIEREAHSDG